MRERQPEGDAEVLGELLDLALGLDPRHRALEAARDVEVTVGPEASDVALPRPVTRGSRAPSAPMRNTDTGVSWPRCPLSVACKRPSAS